MAAAGVGAVLRGPCHRKEAVLCGNPYYRGAGGGRPGMAEKHPEKAWGGDMGIRQWGGPVPGAGISRTQQGVRQQHHTGPGRDGKGGGGQGAAGAVGDRGGQAAGGQGTGGSGVCGDPLSRLVLFFSPEAPGGTDEPDS